jgi:hypothetical protein
MALYTGVANPGLILSDASAVASGVRSSLQNAVNFYLWISAQSDVDLNAAGVAESDVSFMKSMAADLNAFNNVYRGQAPGGAYVLPYAFANSSTQVIGSSSRG